MKYAYREPARTEIFPEGGDQKPPQPHSKRWPLRESKVSKITAVAVLIETSKYTGLDLREIRKRNGVGRPPRQRLERLAARASSFW